VILLPMIAFEAPAETDLLDASLRALDKMDWIIFTSENAVRFFAGRARSMGIDFARLPRPLNVAAVGPVTARAASTEGLGATYTATHHNGSALAAELRDRLAGMRVLLPRSDIAKDDLPRALRETAAQVIEVVAYRTLTPGGAVPAPGGRIMGREEPANPAAAALERVRAGDVDVVTFASPSAFQNFTEMLGAEAVRSMAERVSFAAIGPATAAAIREAGIPVAIEAREATTENLVDAISEHCATK